MFRSARIKLTAWYLLIIMCITFFFSATAYRLSTVEIRRGLHMQALRSNEAQSPGYDESQDISKSGSRADSDHYYSEEGSEHESHHEEGFPLFELFRETPSSFAYDIELFNEESSRVLLSLIALNFIILAASGVASYFLAGRTLRPIEIMMTEQKRFVSDASHELRTPLTAMRTEIEVALRDKSLNIEEAHDVLKSNLEEIEKLQILSDRLLKLGRLQNPDHIAKYESVNMNEVGEDAINQVLPLAANKSIKIEFEPIIGEETQIEAHKDSLVELLIIFLENAVKYSAEDGNVILRMIAKNNSIDIIVQDYGEGIGAEDLPHIFNRFYRADAARSGDRIQGYGLGLSIAKGLVEQYDGKIQVESEPGRGTMFVITFPRKHNRQDDNRNITIRIT